MASKKQADCFTCTRLLKREHEAIRALHTGKASEYQQRVALSAIVNKFSRAHNTLYVPGSFDESAFFSGRAFVGHQILKVLKIPVGQLSYLDEDQPDDNKPEKKSPKKKSRGKKK